MPEPHGGRALISNESNAPLVPVDLASGKYESVAQFPGFSRGISFIGPLASEGLFQVRESAVFSGIPLVERRQQAEERTCGIWVVNIAIGETIGFCKFEDGVQEFFAVEVLAGMRFPDLVNHDPEIVGHSYVLGDEALDEVREQLRG